MSTPEFVVDLQLEPSKRFAEIAEVYAKDLKRLLRSTRKELLADLPFGLRRMVEGAVDAVGAFFVSYLGDHPYVAELMGFAEVSGIDPEDLYLANIVYDLTAGFSLGGLVGCTGFVHGGPPAPLISRAMDWNVPSGIGKHSIVMRYRAKDHEFLSVGFPGITGVVSGISSRGFAVTVNQKFADGWSMPNYALPVLWLVRDVLERGKSYGSATRLLGEQTAASPAFYLMCGSEEGQACLVESDGSSDDVTHVPAGHIQAVSNHSPFLEPPDDIEEGSSEDRLRAMTQRAARIARADVGRARAALKEWPVFHADTVHQMVLVPATGELVLRCPHRGETAYATFGVGQ